MIFPGQTLKASADDEHVVYEMSGDRLSVKSNLELEDDIPGPDLESERRR